MYALGRGIILMKSSKQIDQQSSNLCGDQDRRQYFGPGVRGPRVQIRVTAYNMGVRINMEGGGKEERKR